MEKQSSLSRLTKLNIENNIKNLTYNIDFLKEELFTVDNIKKLELNKLLNIADNLYKEMKIHLKKISGELND
jgi:hypothetical protein